MDSDLKIPLEEARRVFDFLEKVNDLIHQPMAYEDPEQVQKFVDQNYAEVGELYYRVVWNWFPEPVKQQIKDR